MSNVSVRGSNQPLLGGSTHRWTQVLPPPQYLFFSTLGRRWEQSKSGLAQLLSNAGAIECWAGEARKKWQVLIFQAIVSEMIGLDIKRRWNPNQKGRRGFTFSCWIQCSAGYGQREDMVKTPSWVFKMKKSTELYFISQREFPHKSIWLF